MPLWACMRPMTSVSLAAVPLRSPSRNALPVAATANGDAISVAAMSVPAASGRPVKRVSFFMMFPLRMGFGVTCLPETDRSPQGCAARL